MRLSRLLKLSFVGSLLFSPAMAQEASNVHEEALKVLRSGAADTNRTSAPAAAAPLGRETRAERDARLKMEAQQRLADRERLQAEKRRQFEEYVKERERLRSGASPGTVQDQAVKVLREQSNPNAAAAPAVTPAPAAVPPPAAPATRPAPAVQPQPTPAPAVRPAPPQSANDDVQQRALEIIRQQREQPAATAAPVRESELAPRTVATPAPRSTAEDTHQKALEVLRQQQSSTATTAAQPATSKEDDLKPSPELQKRLDEMQRELNTPPPRSAAPVNTQADADYTRELEQRALQSIQQRTAPATAVTRTAPAAPATAKPAVDNNTRELLRRQDEQLRRQSSGVATTPTPRATQPAALSNTIDPVAEQRAREILRQQQQAVSNASAATSAPERAAQPQQPAPVRSTPPPAVAATPTPAPAPASVSTPSAPSDYSKELEERARQSILARSQEQDPSAPQAQAQAAATAAVDPLTAPVTPNPEIDRVHSRAYETLVQVQPGESGKVQYKSKHERLRALTDLYKADRMTPAEYHQRRAAILAEKEQP